MIARLLMVFVLVSVPIASGDPSVELAGLLDPVLAEFVDEQGQVDYGGLKARRSGLKLALEQIAAADRKAVERLDSASQIAFWINAYNAITLAVIIDHHPIEAGLFGGLRFPSSSIRQISGAWTKSWYQAAGEDLSLDAIEHEILRSDFHEPRIHVALVCAASGCPFLRPEAYRGSMLDAQLDDQAKIFLNRPDSLQREGSTLYISAIFDWFEGDFAAAASDAPLGALKGDSAAVLRWVAKFAPARAGTLDDGSIERLKSLDYDWSLNEK